VARNVDHPRRDAGRRTTAPAGRALLQMLGVFAEFERAIIQDLINAGTARTREKGTKSGKPIGRARVDAKVEARLAC
jgi:DNA invertase Pin-like site-specific DNA recombinase